MEGHEDQLKKQLLKALYSVTSAVLLVSLIANQTPQSRMTTQGQDFLLCVLPQVDKHPKAREE